MQYGSAFFPLPSSYQRGRCGEMGDDGRDSPTWITSIGRTDEGTLVVNRASDRCQCCSRKKDLSWSLKSRANVNPNGPERRDVRLDAPTASSSAPPVKVAMQSPMRRLRIIRNAVLEGARAQRGADWSEKQRRKGKDTLIIVKRERRRTRMRRPRKGLAPRSTVNLLIAH